MARENYYTLVASLPRLPYFTEAEWLPLSRKQLDQRLRMLNEQHARELRLAEDLVQWKRQPVSRSSEQMAQAYRRTMAEVTEPCLREFVEYRMGQRSAMVALRRRRLGLPQPATNEAWGVGPWLNLMADNWERPDLGLSSLLPWLEEAGSLLASGHALELENLLMDAVWTRLGRIADRSPFGFEPVMGFVFRLDILQRWMSNDAVQAKTRFQTLVAEVTSEQQQLFA